MPKKKRTKKPKEEMLGTGMVRKTAGKISERRAKQECIINGGTWKPGLGCIQ